MKKIYEILAEKVTKDTLTTALVIIVMGFMMYYNHQNVTGFNETTNSSIKSYESAVERFSATILEVSQRDNEVNREVRDALEGVAKTNIAIESAILGNSAYGRN